MCVKHGRLGASLSTPAPWPSQPCAVVTLHPVLLGETEAQITGKPRAEPSVLAGWWTPGLCSVPVLQSGLVGGEQGQG